MNKKAYEKWQKKLQLLHDESCRLGAKCPGQEGKQAVAAGDLVKGAFVDPKADVTEHVKVIARLLGDYREAVAQISTTTELEGPAAGVPRPSVMTAQDVENLIDRSAAWPATSKGATVDTRLPGILPSAEAERARRRAVEKSLETERSEK